MGRKTAMLLLMLLVVAVAAYLLWPTDEARIRRLVKEGARAAEAEDLEAMMSRVSFSYSDDNGLSYLIIKKNLEKLFGRYSEIIVEYEGLDVELTGDETARARMDLRVIATHGPDRGYFLGDIREPARLVLWLKKGGSMNRWLVVKAAGYLG